MSDESRAIEETAKATGKLADIADKAGSFVTKIIGGASGQMGNILEDWARYFRLKNLVSISDKVESLHRQRLLEGKTIPIPLRLAIPMLEAASLEEDSTLQDLWAGLIANSMDPNFSQNLHPSYIEIVKQMCPDEAVILAEFQKVKDFPLIFYNEGTMLPVTGWFSSETSSKTYEGIYTKYLARCRAFALKQPDRARAYLDNLQRLKLVELGYDLSPQSNGIMGGFWGTPDVVKNSELRLLRQEYCRITTFGESFIQACIIKNKVEITLTMDFWKESEQDG